MHHLVYFFCFRNHHTYTIFALKYYVVVILALRVPSNSVSLLHGFAPCLHTSFPICLLKFSCNSYLTSTCLTTKVASILALFNKKLFHNPILDVLLLKFQLHIPDTLELFEVLHLFLHFPL